MALLQRWHQVWGQDRHVLLLEALYLAYTRNSKHSQRVTLWTAGEEGRGGGDNMRECRPQRQQ